MKKITDVEAHTNALRNRALEIVQEFRQHAASPEKIIELADELTAVISEYEGYAGALDRINAMSEYLITEDCSGPH